MDREKVIKGWECHMEADTLGCADCPYRQGWRTCNFADTLFNDVYALLKEQSDVRAYIEGREQPEIIRCYACKHGEECNSVYLCGKSRGFGIAHDPSWFCADGERKTDDVTGHS